MLSHTIPRHELWNTVWHQLVGCRLIQATEESVQIADLGPVVRGTHISKDALPVVEELGDGVAN